MAWLGWDPDLPTAGSKRTAALLLVAIVAVGSLIFVQVRGAQMDGCARFKAAVQEAMEEGGDSVDESAQLYARGAINDGNTVVMRPPGCHA